MFVLGCYRFSTGGGGGDNDDDDDDERSLERKNRETDTHRETD